MRHNTLAYKPPYRRGLDDEVQGYGKERYSHEGCERILRKRAAFRDSEEAKRWAKSQPWWSRVVHAAMDNRYWAWWIRPEAA